MNDVILNMYMIRRMADIFKQCIKFFAPICINRNIIILCKQCPIINQMHIDISFVCCARFILERERSILNFLNLFMNRFLDALFFLPVPLKHFLSRKILIKNKIKDESNQWQK